MQNYIYKLVQVRGAIEKLFFNYKIIFNENTHFLQLLPFSGPSHKLVKNKRELG